MRRAHGDNFGITAHDDRVGVVTGMAPSPQDRITEQHEASNATATMCCRNHGFEIPFGVVRVDGRKIIDIDEKPEEQFLINAGIYVLNRDAVEQIPFNKFYDMPNLFRKLIKKKFPVSHYISNENWIDIGRHVDLERARENMNDSLLVDGDLK